jgi:hypothetical protein
MASPAVAAPDSGSGRLGITGAIAPIAASVHREEHVVTAGQRPLLRAALSLLQKQPAMSDTYRERLGRFPNMGSSTTFCVSLSSDRLQLDEKPI